MKGIFLGRLLCLTLCGFFDSVLFLRGGSDFLFNFNRSYLLHLFFFLKKSSFLRTLQLLDIFGVDCLSLKRRRFDIIFYLNSFLTGFRFFCFVNISVKNFLDSLEGLFFSANWLEREVWDMFGIFFYKNKDLRRILTDYGFDGFPLRKDYPLSGFFEIRYSSEYKGLLLEPFESSQVYRFYSQNTSPWVVR